ncbi:MAG: SGNH/GDSL hydrolase family protein [Verrucomicrobia bacterium]|jgi:hypothetical protein|nr:SGNH/GDSL hydrolase family protein [Verrucomicrobiota bacterium]
MSGGRGSRFAAKQWLGRVGLLLATLFLLEVGVRFVLRGITTTAQSSFFSTRWAQSGAVQTNRLGFREREFDATPAPSISRICMVGDSLLFGQGLPVEARLSHLLEAQLNEREPRFEILNFGTKGANLPEHVAALQGSVLPVRPDLVLLQWFVNDADAAGAAYPSLPRLLPRGADRFLTRHSAIWSLAGITLERIALCLRLRESYWSFTRSLLEDEDGPAAIAARECLEAFVEVCRDEDVALGVILFPDLGVDLGEGYPLGFLMDRTLAQCRELGVPCLDLRAAYREVPREQWGAMQLNRLDSHPSAAANALAAKCVHDWLLPLLEQAGQSRVFPP